MTNDVLVPVKRALLSVSDKSGLVEFAQALVERGVELISTGGTARTLREAGLAVRDVSDVTGFPEMMDGRVKTLHPKVHGGLLARGDNDKHVAAAETHGIGLIDLLVVSLYPFEETLAAGAASEAIIENIDIGGPAMIRAAAKNHDRVAVVVSSGDYDELLTTLEKNSGATTFSLRRRLAAKAYGRTATYDAAIATWLADETDQFAPDFLAVGGTLVSELRYGENPHQGAALYTAAPKTPGAVSARRVQGKALSYNNINDTDAAFELVAEFPPQSGPAVAIIKHANPCGVAVASNLTEAYRSARACDPVSAFGGIVAANRTIDRPTAEAIVELFTEVVIAPDADADALEVFASKKDLRLLLTGGLPDTARSGRQIRPVAGGFILQSRDNGSVSVGDLNVVTERKPSDAEIADMLFAFRVAKHVKSNAIVYARDGATVGIGAGQMSRVDSARIAISKSRDAAATAGISGRLTDGAVVASDAFFPFADGLLAAADAGVTAVIQPGGSIRDEDVIKAADEKGLAMVFTGMRHFRH